MNPPNTMFQLSGVHCRGLQFREVQEFGGLGKSRGLGSGVHGLRVLGASDRSKAP